MGLEIVKAVLESGDKVVATARKPGQFPASLSNDSNLFVTLLDVTSEEQAKMAVGCAIQHFGRIDVLVNNAGYGLLGAIEESGASEVEAIYRTNVFGLLNVTRAVLPLMRKQGSGHILNMSSLGGYQASAGWGIYCSTKFAVEGITEALHAELQPLGIHATVVEPGFFRTDFMDGSSLQRTRGQLEAYAATVGKTRAFADAHSGQQPGDPAKLARVLLEIIAAAEPPLRLPVGPDAVRRIEAKNNTVAIEIERWRILSESTNLIASSRDDLANGSHTK
jgi:NAD(P)-dependent dehydrogenase (short-subunit alcohol dehydrogenase family)